jgi:[ribosomal protein S5]-alanine N-acetyltransferase
LSDIDLPRPGKRIAIGESSPSAGPLQIPILHTQRLLLRPMEMADAAQIQAIFPQWEIVKYLNAKVPWPYPDDGAEMFIREMALPAMQRGEEIVWTLRLKPAPEELIGSISLALKSEDENRGFWLVPNWRGRGLMTEACEAVTDYWFDVLKRPVLRAPKAIASEGSRRISERQGMRVIWRGERDYVSGRLPSETWEITAEEWRARKRVR